MRSSTSLESTLFSHRFIRRAVAVLVVGLLLLIVSNYLFLIKYPDSPERIRFQISMDSEGNFATWFNSTLMLLVAVTAALVAWIVSGRIEDTRDRMIDVGGWLAVGVLFLYVSIDDAARIHDSLAGISRDTLESTSIPILSELGRSSWILFFGTIGIVAAGCMMFFFRRNLWNVRPSLVFVLLGLLLFCLVPLAEIMENRHLAQFGREHGMSVTEKLRQIDQGDWLALQTWIIVEETSEMLGAICFLTAFLIFGERALSSGPVTRASSE